MIILFQIPAIFLSAYLIEKTCSGRKNTLSYSLLIVGIVFVIVFVLKGRWLMLLVGLAKFLTAIIVSVLGVFIAELYPTMIRATAISIITSSSRFGGAVMPFVLIWSFRLGPVGPFLMCGIIALISSFSGFSMPTDTTG